MTLVKESKEGFIQEIIAVDIGRLLQWEREWAQLQIQQEQVGIYSQGAGWRSIARKLLRENVRRNKGFWLNGPNKIFAGGRPNDQISFGGW